MIDLLCRRCGFQSDAQIAAVRAGWEGDVCGIEKYRGNESLNNAYYAGAVGGGHLSIVERLLEQGASPNEEQEEAEEVTGTFYYRIPLDWVERGRHDECAAIIRKAGGVRSTELSTPLYTQY